MLLLLLLSLLLMMLSLLLAEMKSSRHASAKAAGIPTHIETEVGAVSSMEEMLKHVEGIVESAHKRYELSQQMQMAICVRICACAYLKPCPPAWPCFSPSSPKRSYLARASGFESTS